MMAGNPNWWSVYPLSLISPKCALGSSSVSFSSLTDNQDTPQSWSQMLATGVPIEEDRLVPSTQFQTENKFEAWNGHILNPAAARFPVLNVIKQEVSHTARNMYVHGHEEFQASGPVWSQSQFMPPASSPMSCVSSLSNTSIFDFTDNKAGKRNQLPDRTSECNSTTGVAVCKKAKVQPSSQPHLKVRKEKLGDRITALHQLVSPFGKTDTASVLLEAIGYIRFLEGQIEALTTPYMGNTPKHIRNQQSAVHGERNCVFPEDPGQLLQDTCLKRKGAPNQDAQEPKDLRSRGLCLVPVSCTSNVGSINGVDYWSQVYGGGF